MTHFSWLDYIIFFGGYLALSAFIGIIAGVQR